MINRRSLITGLISFVAAPAIVRAESLMKVKVITTFTVEESWQRILDYEIDKLAKRVGLDILYGTIDTAILTSYDNDGLIYKPVRILNG